MKAFIFDFDGVVVDSEHMWRELGDKVFYPSIIPGWTVNDGGRMMGLGAKDGFELLITEYGLKMSYEEYERRRKILIDEIYAVNSPPTLPGLESLLDRLEALKIPIAIGSSSGRDWIDWTLSRLNLSHRFPLICCSDDVAEGRTKPWPDIYLLAAERLDVAPADCVVMEDSKNGLAAAKAAGMTCICIRTHSNQEQDLSRADHMVTQHDQLTTEFLQTL